MAAKWAEDYIARPAEVERPDDAEERVPAERHQPRLRVLEEQVRDLEARLQTSLQQLELVIIDVHGADFGVLVQRLQGEFEDVAVVEIVRALRRAGSLFHPTRRALAARRHAEGTGALVQMAEVDAGGPAESQRGR